MSSSINLSITSKTWRRAQYDLFDFEDLNTINKKTTVNNEVSCYRVEDQLVFLNQRESYQLYSEEDYLFSIKSKKNFLYLSNEKINNLWLIISKRLNIPYSELNENSIFKLGRSKFKVIALQHERIKYKHYQLIAKHLKNHYDNEGLQYKTNSKFINEENTHSNLCRICLSDNFDIDNPLISPCSCSGSMKYIHINCLRTWIKNRMNFQENNGVISLNYKFLHCELCKRIFTLKFQITDKEYNLIDFFNSDNSTQKSLILQSLDRHNNITGMHFIDFSKKKEIYIGRSNECDIKCHDISVSRFHAVIKLSDKGFQIHDNFSKFGTTILVNKPLKLKKESSFDLQFGRTIINIKFSTGWMKNMIRDFFCSAKKNNKFLYDENEF